MGTTADNQLIEASPDLITFLSCMDKEYTTTYYPGKHLQVNSITDPNLYGSSPSCDLREYSESGCKYAQSSCHYNVEGGKIQSRAAEISLSGYQSNFVDTCFNKCNTDGNANSVLDQQDTTYNVFVGCSESNS